MSGDAAAEDVPDARPPLRFGAARDLAEPRLAIGLGGPHRQTIVGSLGFGVREPSSETRLFALDDGDRLAAEVTTPTIWRPGDASVVLVHGLCGFHGSPYLVRIARALASEGVRVFRLNLRGCGSGAGLARGIYHSGRSEDVLAVVRELRAASPDAQLALAGFSLGGNIVLKLAGELGADGSRWVDRVLALAPPADLTSSSARLGRRSNRIYDRYFVRELRRSTRALHERFPDLGPVSLPARLTLRGFDEVYTAPRAGFLDAADYYVRASAARSAEHVSVETRVLFAIDDPVIDPTALDGLRPGEAVRVRKTRGGGHLGFLVRSTSESGWRWLDAQVLAWLGFGPGD